MSIDSYTHEHTGTCPECNYKGWLSDDHGGLCEDCFEEEHEEETMSKKVWKELTSEQDSTLQLYAEWYGKGWQEQLWSDWMRAGSRAPLDFGPLQQLRNSHGPMWLKQVHPA